MLKYRMTVKFSQRLRTGGEDTKILISEHIRKQVIKNLLLAHERIAGEGDVKSIVMLSKFILQLSKSFNNELLELRSEKDNDAHNTPPDEG